MRIFSTCLAILAAGSIAFGDDHAAHAPAAASVPVPAADAHVAHAAPSASASTSAPTPDQALKQLTDGNGRFVRDERTLPRQSEDRRCDTFANGQHPVAAVLACADSRVPVEMIFDQGIGDLFTVRVAGNVADSDEIGTIEYGIEHLHIPLIVVIGHAKCGAVTAVVDGAHVEGHLAKLVDNIIPAAEQTKKANPNLTGSKLVAAAIRMNVRQAISDLTNNSKVIGDAVKAGKVKIVGGVYDLHSGNVNWLDTNESMPAVSDVKTSAPKSADDHAAAASKAAAPKAHAPASSSHGKPGAPANSPAGAHGADKHDDSHDAHSKKDPHGAHSSNDSHDEAGDAHKPSGKSANPGHNWYALGGIFAGSSATSIALVHLIQGRKKA